MRREALPCHSPDRRVGGTVTDNDNSGPKGRHEFMPVLSDLDYGANSKDPDLTVGAIAVTALRARLPRYLGATKYRSLPARSTTRVSASFSSSLRRNSR